LFFAALQFSLYPSQSSTIIRSTSLEFMTLPSIEVILEAMAQLIQRA
jgi:hypothetical protein